ncbi:MAG: type IX secretion system membrane protein PorP/SprF [Bacteroidota bacterium]
MKKILTTIILASFALITFAQQEPQYTQFVYNKLGLNAGYAGSQETACLTVMFRNQWLGLKGAPNTQVLNFNMPILDRRVGIGGSITRSAIGISERITIEGTYSYRIRVATGMLGLGVQTSMRYLSNDFSSDELVSSAPLALDGAIPNGFRSKYVPNFGAGAYFQNEKFYLGVSVPRLLSNNVDFNEDGMRLSEETLHAYLMTGYLLEINEKVDFKPQLLVKYAAHAPFDADINASFVFSDLFTAGLTYRLGGGLERNSGESIDVLLGAQINSSFLFGISYDITLTKIREYTSGTIEGVVRYCVGKTEEKELINPRFF